MSSSINTKLAIAIPAATVVLFAAGYFGLSSYASGKAEKTIRDFLYDYNLENAVSWKSISSSPFGGTITLKGVEFDQQKPYLVELKADKVVLRDYVDSGKRTRFKIDVSKLDVIDEQSAFGRMIHDDLFETPLVASGQTRLEPQNLSFALDFQPDDSKVQASISLDIPKLFKVETSAELGNINNLLALQYISHAHPALDFLPQKGRRHNIYGRYLEDTLYQSMQEIQLTRMDFSYRDLGYLKRANLLEQRYNMPLTPVQEDNSKARQTAFNNKYKSMLDECGKKMRNILPDPDKSCKALVGTWMSKEKGLKFSVKPDGRVRLQDFERLDDNEREARRFIERLNLKLSTL